MTTMNTPSTTAREGESGEVSAACAVHGSASRSARRRALWAMPLALVGVGLCLSSLSGHWEPTTSAPGASVADQGEKQGDEQTALTRALEARAERAQPASRNADRSAPAGAQAAISGVGVAPAASGYAGLALVAQDTQRAVEGATRAAEQASAAAASAVATAEEVQRVAREQAEAEAAAKAAAEAEAAAQAKAAAAAAKAAAEAQAAARDPRGLGRSMAADRGWTGAQFTCLDRLWTRESGWNYKAANPSSSAFGIPQALPGKKMATAGADWQTNPATQIKWGLGYIKSVYGSPCGAWEHSENVGWY